MPLPVVCPLRVSSYPGISASGFAETPPPLIRALGLLHFLDAAVDLLAERHTIELVEHRAVEALDDAVGLRALHFRARVIDVLHRQAADRATEKPEVKPPEGDTGDQRELVPVETVLQDGRAAFWSLGPRG